DKVRAPGRDRLFNGAEGLVEPHAEVRVVPADARPFHVGEEEPQIVADLIGLERLVVDGRVDAEAAGVWAAKAREHRDDLDRRRFLERLGDVLPPLADTRQLARLLARVELQADGPVLLAAGQNVENGLLVGEAED